LTGDRIDPKTSYQNFKWLMVANKRYPCKFVKKVKGEYMYNCAFRRSDDL
jgi:hypothetical protein